MELSQFAAIIRRWLWLIVLVSVASGVVAFAVSSVLPKGYEARARVLVGGLTNTNHDTLLAFQQLAQTYAELAISGPIVERVGQEQRLPDAPKDLAKRITVSAPLGDVIIRIDATGATADEAAGLANTVADEITRFARPLGESTSLATVAEPAVPPDAPASPRVLLNTAVAIALGLGIGIVLALVLDRVRQMRAASERAAWIPPAAARGSAAERDEMNGSRDAGTSPAPSSREQRHR